MWIGEERTDNGVTIWDYLQLSSLTLGRSKIKGFLQTPLHSIPCWSCWRSQSWDYHTKSPTPFCGSCYGLLFWEPEAWSSVCTERWFFLFWPDSPLVKKLSTKLRALITYAPCYDYGRQAVLDTIVCSLFVMVDGSGWLSGFFHAVWTTVEPIKPDQALRWRTTQYKWPGLCW